MQMLTNVGDGFELPPLDASVLPMALTDNVKTVVLIVADGLGHLQLQREIERGNAPHLAQLITLADQNVAYSAITSVFPTTTVAALGSVNSGVTPTAHGLLSY